MNKRWMGWFVVLAWMGMTPLGAVFVSTPEPNAQEIAPEDDRGWSNMARYEKGGAVYLGKGWFLTAGHLGDTGTVVRFAGERYPIDASSWTPILTSLELKADLRLFRVVDPEIIEREGVALLDRELELNDPVTLIGPGREVSEVVPTDTDTRFYQGEGVRMRWGTNLVSDFTEVHDGLGFRSSTFDTSIAHGEAQALDRDSGGGVFVVDETTGTARLAGIMIAAALRQDERGTYAYKSPSVDSEQSSWTRSVHLYDYQDQITAILSPSRSAEWLWALAGLTAVLLLAKFLRRG